MWYAVSMKKIKGLCLAAAGYLLWQKWELEKFNITTYRSKSPKIKGHLKIAVVADLHAHEYGNKNDSLFQRIKAEKPDLILVPGDMIISKYTETFPVAYHAFEELVKIAPVYFSYGNHESRVSKVTVRQTGAYLKYEEKVRRLGVHFLRNETELIEVKGEKIALSGLEIPLKCYAKGERVLLPKGFMQEALGEPKEKYLQILMAHNPMYAKEYARWGADITVCGHTHGGLVRFPKIGSILSPQLLLFPKYDGGAYEVFGKKIYVSKGLGTHTFHIRILNRAEVLLLEIN